MSRTLSKVLIICALVVLISLTIVGTALAAYHSIENTIVIEAVFENGEVADKDSDGYAYVSFDGKANTKLNVKAGHLNSVELGVDYNEAAYSFVGWFEGDKVAYQNAVNNGEVEKKLTQKASINVKMNGADNYVAVFSVNKYSVGKWMNGSSTASPEGAKNSSEYYVYGEELPTVSLGKHFHFKGWQVVADPELREDEVVAGAVEEDETPEFYTRATFDTKSLKASDGVYQVYGLSYTNEVSFDEDKKVTVTYNGLDSEATEEVYVGESFNLKNPTALEFTRANGYTYSWKTENGETYAFDETITIKEDLTLTLNKTAIVYSAVLTDYEGLLANNANPKTVNFTVETSDFGNFEAWLDLEAKYSYWWVAGVKYQSKVYTEESFDEFITTFVNANPSETATAELTVELGKAFTKLEIKSASFSAKRTGEMFYDSGVYLTNSTSTPKTAGSKSLQDENYATNSLLKEYALGQELFAQDSDGRFKEVAYTAMQITVEGKTPMTITAEEFDINGNIYDLIEYILTKREVAATETLTITSIQFMFDIV